MPFLYIILAVLILLMMITIHEFGHYIVGKLLKFKINEFSIGFGPKIFSKKNKKTGEIFSLRILPLGGYCAFEGEDELADEKHATFSVFENENIKNVDGKKFEESAANETGSAQAVLSQDEENRSLPELKTFNKQEPWKRILVLLSGAAFNFVSAVIFAFIFLCLGGNMTTVVVEKKFDSYGNEYNASLMVGDKIIKVNGTDLTVMNTFSDEIAKIEGDSAVFTVVRNGETLDVTVIKTEIYDEINGNYRGFGFTSGNVATPMNIGSALINCIPYTLKLSWLVLGTLGQLLTGRLSLSALSGPVSTVKFMADAARQNWLNIFLLLPLISANLAIFNIMPIPALDGSKVVFTLIEWIRGKPINRKVEAYIHAAGMLFLLGFCIVVEIFQFLG